MEPENNQTETESIVSQNGTVLAAFIDLCRIIKESWKITSTQKVYHTNFYRCTVTIPGKSFKGVHEDPHQALAEALTAASLYMIRTYSALSGFKGMLEQLEKEKARFCTPVNGIKEIAKLMKNESKV